MMCFKCRNATRKEHVYKNGKWRTRSYKCKHKPTTDGCSHFLPKKESNALEPSKLDRWIQ